MGNPSFCRTISGIPCSGQAWPCICLTDRFVGSHASSPIVQESALAVLVMCPDYHNFLARIDRTSGMDTASACVQGERHDQISGIDELVFRDG